MLEEPANDAPAENYLLVGSDSREGIDADDPNAGAIGDTDDVVGRRSDTIMILRRERNGGASLLSLPRDLWVPIAGTGERRRRSTRPTTTGPSGSPRRSPQALGIPIHHYVEVDFAGFTGLVDEIGGVEICIVVRRPRTPHSGLDLAPGLPRTSTARRPSPTPAAATTRSGSTATGSDDGTRRPRPHRAPAAVHPHRRRQAAARRWRATRSSSASSIGAAHVGGHGRRQSLDPVKAAAALRQAAEVGLGTYSLPVDVAEHGGQAALELDDDEAQPILDYFRGVGPPPPTTPPTTDG